MTHARHLGLLAAVLVTSIGAVGCVGSVDGQQPSADAAQEADAGVEPDAAPVISPAVAAAISRSAPYIEQQGLAWIEEHACVSCHRVSFMTWSLAKAQQHGIVVSDRVAEITDWSLGHLLSVRENGVVTGELNLEGLSQMILGRDLTTTSPSRLQAFASFVDLILAAQRPDGSWEPGGQLPVTRRSVTETTEVSAMWMSLALAQAAPSDGRVVQAINNARSWFMPAGTGTTTEWFAARLLVQHYLGDADDLGPWLPQLRAAQNADGGWPWIAGEASDALATGQALYALGSVGLSTQDSSVKRGHDFLLASQLSNGSWEVPSTRTANNGSIAETATYWGTTWAVIGLLEAATN